MHGTGRGGGALGVGVSAWTDRSICVGSRTDKGVGTGFGMDDPLVGDP